MEQIEAETKSIMVSVKEVADFYRGNLQRESVVKNKSIYDGEKYPLTRTKDLHMAKINIRRLAESRKHAESVKTVANTELSTAREMVEDLSLKIEDSNKRAKSQRKELHMLRKSDKSGYEWPLAANVSDTKYMEVVKELELMKKELLRLKIEMASLLESKQQAERQVSSFVSRTKSHSSSIDALRKEIDETVEEEVLVELAKMEAIRELQAIEAEREAKSVQFSSTLEETQHRMTVLREELLHRKDVEQELEVTNSELRVLENELMLVRGITSPRTTQTHSPNFLKKMTEKVEDKEEQSDLNAELKNAMSELTDANKELHAIKEEGFKFMASIDIIREELKHVSEKTAQLHKAETRAESTVQYLNYKLIKANSKLEAANLAEEKAKSILSNLTITLRKMEAEKDAITKERDEMVEEMLSIKQEIQNMELEIELEEGKLLSVMQELETLKKSEVRAMEYLKAVTEKTMQIRTSKSSRKSTITISNFEFEYLTHHAKAAEEIADKKVAAAQAWIEALKAGEKEILLKTKIAQKEIEELKAIEDQERRKTDEAMSAKKKMENELHKRQLEEKEKEELLLISSLAKENGPVKTPRTSRNRRPSLSGINNVGRSNTVNFRKNRKVVPSLVKIFGGNKAEKEL